MKLAHRQAPKTKLNQTLRSWLPILQASADELPDALKDALGDNPFAEVEMSNAKISHSSKINYSFASDGMERIYKQSLYEKLYSQISASLFPSKQSQQIALLIIECINKDGYFEYSKDILKDFTKQEVERIRMRFAYLEPVGVGAKDLKESFLFQLDDLDIEDEELYKFTKNIIKNLDKLESFTNDNYYDEAIKILKKFKNPPAIDFFSEEQAVEPDLFVVANAKGIQIKLNDDYYPKINIDAVGLDTNLDFVQTRIKQAKDLIDALDMRKSTLYKIGLMIIEYQYDYFFGGDIKPMKLQDIADDLGRNSSTISRAISNKYLESQRGLVSLKSFFASEVGGDEDVSNAAIKDFIKNLISKENQAKPYSDEAILKEIKNEFKINLVRRTVTKYRKLLNIAGSSERKKIYKIQGEVISL